MWRRFLYWLGYSRFVTRPNRQLVNRINKYGYHDVWDAPLYRRR